VPYGLAGQAGVTGLAGCVQLAGCACLAHCGPSYGWLARIRWSRPISSGSVPLPGPVTRAGTGRRGAALREKGVPMPEIARGLGLDGDVLRLPAARRAGRAPYAADGRGGR